MRQRMEKLLTNCHASKKKKKEKEEGGTADSVIYQHQKYI